MGGICGKEKSEKLLENSSLINNKINDKIIIENNNIKNEVFIKGKVEKNKVDFDTTDKIRKSVCKLIIFDKRDKKFGTGFFLIYQNKKFLITCYHVINQEINNFYLEIWNKETKKFELNKHFIKFFQDADATVIELNNSEDFINDIVFLDYDLNFLKGYLQYKNIEVFSVGYLYGDKIHSDSGKIIEINGFELYHDINTEVGYSGSPIILCTTLKVIGIHKGGERKKNINFGVFIGEILKEINNPQIIVKDIMIERKNKIDIIITNGFTCLIYYNLSGIIFRDIGFLTKILVDKNVFLTGLLTKYYIDENKLYNMGLINIYKNRVLLEQIQLNDHFFFSDEFLNITFINIKNTQLDYIYAYEKKNISGNIDLINYSKTKNIMSQTSAIFKGKWGIAIKYLSDEPFLNSFLLVDNKIVGVHKKSYVDYDLAINIDVIFKAISLNYTESIKGKSVKTRKSKFSTETDIYNLVKKGLELTDIPNLFVSPSSLFVTPIWFLRTKHAWYWTPTEPKKEDLDESNWMIIVPKNSLEVIGGYWDGEEPADRNIKLIHWLEESKLTYCD